MKGVRGSKTIFWGVEEVEFFPKGSFMNSCLKGVAISSFLSHKQHHLDKSWLNFFLFFGGKKLVLSPSVESVEPSSFFSWWNHLAKGFWTSVGSIPITPDATPNFVWYSNFLCWWQEGECCAYFCIRLFLARSRLSLWLSGDCDRVWSSPQFVSVISWNQDLTNF